MGTSDTMVSDQTNTLGNAAMSHYHHISTEERKSISELFHAGHAIRQIAARLGRSPSTISRELRRNRSDVASAVLYHPEAAALAYQTRRKRCVRPHLLSADADLRHTVHFLLGCLYWSPAQISARLKKRGHIPDQRLHDLPCAGARASAGACSVFRCLQAPKP